jgi:carboxypeptidase C (cathepsin A)
MRSNGKLNYKWGDSMNFYRNDIKDLYERKNFSSWLFSGTEDIACVTLGTLRTLNELNFPIKEKWKKWKVDGQVAGMEQTYDYGLKFFTVKNSGHSVISDQPKASQILFDKFLEANKISTKIEPNKKHLVNDLFDGLYTKDIYSGYLPTDVEGTELFYIFTPSQSSPESDPIILWLNGGPGSSSLIGLFEEIGPVLFTPNKKKPVLNEYAWNKNANVFFYRKSWRCWIFYFK